MDKCIFGDILRNCKSTNTTFTSISEVRLESVIKASKERRDQLHSSLDRSTKYHSHPSCLSTYTSTHHINRHKRTLPSESDESSRNKVTRRSCQDGFDFKKHCLYCGDVCPLEPDPKHPARWKKATLCTTADRGTGNKSYKDVILEVCKQRCDSWAEQVQIRVSGSNSDLHASNGRYHIHCRDRFMPKRNITAAKRHATKEGNIIIDASLKKLVKSMHDNRSMTWSSSELHRIYSTDGGTLSKKGLMQKITQHFSNEIIVLSSPGLANILMFKDHAASVMHLENDNDEFADISKIAKMIVKEAKDIEFDKEKYKENIDFDTLFQDVSPTLNFLLSEISSSLNQSLPSLLIGSIITSVVCKRFTTLQVALAVFIREKLLIERLHEYMITCHYDEFLRFRTSAALAQETVETNLTPDGGLVQVVGDNLDLPISSLNGLKQTHDLAMILTQYNSKAKTRQEGTEFTRLSRESLKDVKIKDVPVTFYKGPKNPQMPLTHVFNPVLPLKVLAHQKVALFRSQEEDYKFLCDMATLSGVPEYSGYNKKRARESGRLSEPATTIVYTPILNRKPSDPTTMLSAMLEAKKLTAKTGQNITVFTADQQLYKIMIDVVWVYPEMFTNFLPRLGGMHWLMSFIGSVGMLMTNSGLEEILKSRFGGVPKMLSGKNFPSNVRALRLVTEELLRKHIPVMNCYTELAEFLHKASLGSRTTKHWVNNLIKPVLLMMLFIRAEREGDWPLHLYACNKMLPYFFAAGHTNYARSGTYYVRQMNGLTGDILNRFMKGEHVMKLKDGLWNGLWSDMSIEMTYMRHGKGNKREGGLVGVTVNPEAAKKATMSLHTFARVKDDLESISRCSRRKEEKHKEEMPSRIMSDEADRSKLRSALEACVDPLQLDGTSDDIINIYSGEVGKSSVNVDKSVEEGKEMMEKFVSSWPEGYRGTISKKITTMAVSKKGVNVNGTVVYNTEMLFSRVMSLISAGKMDITEIFAYELSPIPTSIFDEYGMGRYPKAKSELKNALKVEISIRTVPAVDTVVLDGCALLWVTHWPDKGTMLDFVKCFSNKVSSYLKETNVYLIFDRYYDYSPKSSTRQERLGRVSTHHQLTLTSSLPSQSTILTSTRNKVQLIEIIAKYLFENMQSNKKLIITSANEVPEEIQNGLRRKRDDLSTSHEEADLVIPQQVLFAVNNGATCVKVICDDTDVFVLLTYFFNQKNLTATILMEATSEEWKVIDIGKTVAKHQDIIPFLIGGHAISGCDTVPQMFGIGKKTMLKKLRDFPVQSLGKLGVSMEEIMSECRLFVASCYGFPGDCDMSSLRYKVWKRKTETGKLTQSFKLCALPPTNAALEQNILRAHTQCANWYASLERNPPILDLSKYGWYKDLKLKTLVPVMVPDSVKLVPDEILKRISCKCPTKHCSINIVTGSSQCSCAKAQMNCSVFCSCNEDLCENKRDRDEEDDENEEDNDVIEHDEGDI